MKKDELIYRAMAVLMTIYTEKGRLLKLHEFYRIMKDELECSRKECYIIGSTLRNGGYIKMDDGYCGLTDKGYKIVLAMFLKGTQNE